MNQPFILYSLRIGLEMLAAGEAGYVPISPAQARPLIDCVDIADSAARCDIEINCLAIFDHTTRRVDRYDTRRLIDTGPHPDDHAEQRESVDRALRYLIARNKIELDPHAPHLVRFPKEAA